MSEYIQSSSDKSSEYYVSLESIQSVSEQPVPFESNLNQEPDPYNTITVEVVDSDDESEHVVILNETKDETKDVSDNIVVQETPAVAQERPPNPPFVGIPVYKRSFQKMVCLAGMPRAGGTLLTALLAQNPKIHTEGHSPLCQLMWDTYLSYQDKCNREFASNGKDAMLPQIVGQMPHSYYQNVPEGTEIVVDRCRSWTHECNVNMLKGCVDPNIKIIVLERPIQEVVESYARLFTKNHMGSALESVLPQLLNANTEPILRSMEGVRWAKAYAKAEAEADTFLFLTYDELVRTPLATLAKVYRFCGMDMDDFECHDVEHVVMKYPEDEKVHGLVGQYVVHPKVERKVYAGEEKIVLPEKVMEVVKDIEKHFQY
jgi:sulfotransferase